MSGYFQGKFNFHASFWFGLPISATKEKFDISAPNDKSIFLNFSFLSKSVLWREKSIASYFGGL